MRVAAFNDSTIPFRLPLLSSSDAGVKIFDDFTHPLLHLLAIQYGLAMRSQQSGVLGESLTPVQSNRAPGT